DDTSDILKVRYSMSAAGAIPVRRLGGPFTAYVLENNLGCSVGDVVLVSNGAACFMTLVESVSADNATLAVDTEPPVVPTKVACMGDWQEYAYRIDNNQLIRQIRKPDELLDEAIVDNVVALQAQYGVSASPDSNRVVEWTNAVGIWSSASLDADVTLRNRIKAVRVAVVARSDLREKEEVTQACETFQGIDKTALVLGMIKATKLHQELTLHHSMRRPMNGNIIAIALLKPLFP
ncbi:MAG: PilW family protein, partial [Methylophilaceae bacterium]|nr:PilW family protein [Methylophilaceae bacterium]